MPEDMNWRLIRVRLFEMGHSFEYIDNLGTGDLGDVLGYWSGKAKAEESAAKDRKRQSDLHRGKS